MQTKSVATEFQKRRSMGIVGFIVTYALGAAVIFKMVPQSFFWPSIAALVAIPIYIFRIYRCPSCSKAFPRAMRNPMFNVPKACPNCQISFEA